MIAAADAARIGTSVAFPLGGHERVEAATGRLLRLGIRHVRMGVDEAVFRTSAGRAWYDWLFRMLGVEFTLLPSLSGAADEAFAATVIERHGNVFESLELRLGDDRSWRALAVAKQAGKQVVAGGARAEDVAALAGRDGVAAIGLAATGDESLIALGQAAAAALRHSGSTAALWMTEAGSGRFQFAPCAQLAGFLEAVDAPLARVYWSGLQDVGEDVGTEGTPTLLGRLLGHGVPEVRRVLGLERRAPASRPVLVTGGAGFIGCNLADRLANEGHDVLVYDSLARPGVERNLHWLAQRHPSRISFAIRDMRDDAGLAEAARQASAVFHLAGQVAVTTSLAQPMADYAINLAGTVHLLEALRRDNPMAPLVFASTNKVYGDLADIALQVSGQRYLPVDAAILDHGVSEARPLDFHTPYGCSKGAADQYVLDYARSFGLQTAVLRMSCIYGQRQLGTEDQGWVAHFLLRALAGEGITLYGDGMQVRDILHVDDAVDAYMKVWHNIGRVKGRAYNLGGGPENSVSLLQLVDHIGGVLGHPVETELTDWRAGDQRYFVADARAIGRDLGWAARRGWRSGVAGLAKDLAAAFPRTDPWLVPATAAAQVTAG